MVTFVKLVDAGGESADSRDAKLRQQNWERHAGENREVKGGSGRGTQSFRRKRIGGAALAGGGGGGSGGSERGCGADDGANVAGILDAREDYKEGRAGFIGRAEKIVESGGARFD